jgi:hypothetical protein
MMASRKPTDLREKFKFQLSLLSVLRYLSHMYLSRTCKAISAKWMGVCFFTIVVKYYRVAAIFPERFQCFTIALKTKLFIIFSPQNRISCLPKPK